MKEELTKKEITNNKDSKQKIVVFGIVFIFAILFIIIMAFTLLNGDSQEKEKPSNSNSNVDNYYNYDYKYVLKTAFGADFFIYLLNDNSVKVVGKIPKMAVGCPEGTDCVSATGEYSYEEKTIEFSEKTMVKVRDFISSFFEKKLTNYLDISELELTREQEIIRTALLLNFEDLITLEDDLIFETKTKELKNSTGKVIFEMSKTTLTLSSNEVVNKIANYLNAIVENDWNLLDEECKKVLSEGFVFSGNDKMEFTLKLEDFTASTISFTYSMTGTFEETVRGSEKGFVFDSVSGELEEYPEGFKNSEAVLEEFKKSSEYKDMKENLKLDWEKVLTENMYTSGYWYLKDDKIIFIIPEEWISDSPLRGHVIEIQIENKNI